MKGDWCSYSHTTLERFSLFTPVNLQINVRDGAAFDAPGVCCDTPSASHHWYSYTKVICLISTSNIQPWRFIHSTYSCVTEIRLQNMCTGVVDSYRRFQHWTRHALCEFYSPSCLSSCISPDLDYIGSSDDWPADLCVLLARGVFIFIFSSL